MIYETTTAAYLDTVRNLIYNPEFRSAPRGKKILELIHYKFSINTPDSKPILTLSEERNEVLRLYTQKEFELYEIGATTAEEFSKASKFWGKLANPDGTINSAYGHLIFFDKSCGNSLFDADFSHWMRTPWEWARMSLIQDKDSRQSILKFHKRGHLWLGNKDQVCTLAGVFLIRNDRLHFSIHMRSNDVIKGLSYDLPWFCYLMERMCKELLPTYPDLKIGSYTHFVDSLHLYEADLATAHQIIGHLPQSELNLSETI